MSEKPSDGKRRIDLVWLAIILWCLVFWAAIYRAFVFLEGE